MKNSLSIVPLLFFMLLGRSLAIAGVQHDPKEIPVLESTDLEILYSSEAIVLVKLTADKFLQYENGDGVYPMGIYAECYDKNKKTIAKLRANTAYHYGETDLWELTGDVEVEGFYNNQVQLLNTEQVFWNVKSQQLYTDRFIRLESPHELLTGKGLTANQDLSNYTLDMPEGFAQVDTTEFKSK